MTNYFIIIFLILFFSGCARLSEITKTVWGSSTRALDDARASAVTETFSCSFNDGWKEVFKVALEEEWQVFIADKISRHIVIMGVKGNVNTTEVGIFFDEMEDEKLTIDISSLSSSAKNKVADILFMRLNEKF